ncbi:uncharacterized protein LOC100900135 [Galendromus occidentalis]|uniref:Uncharacterized protein LOC100900135 n=1 Tax=Galendromus occidentalis TaxID=34638 RepID=A0AAJ6QVY4_9ACAR|nr:uncharacterized protein LOC100900135 [Galendromus occidentalis]
MRDIRLSAYGYSVTCRVAQSSLRLDVSADLIRDMVREALGQVSNESDLKLENISVSRSGFKIQFVHDPSLTEMSVLQPRSGRKASPDFIDGVLNYGGTFKKVRNHLGLYYLFITEEPVVDLSASPIEVPRNAVLQRPSLNVTPRSVGLSPARERKRELYQSLFDEDIDEHEKFGSPEKPIRSSPKAAGKKVPPKNPSIGDSEVNVVIHILAH